MSKILVVEDDLASQLLIRRIVENMGHEVLTSPNGQHAYETMSRDNAIKLVITDYMMPEMDGIRLVENLRHDSLLKKIPVIMVSAVITINEISNLLHNGVDFFLGKPVARPELENYVRYCLDKGHGSVQPTTN